MDIFAYALQMEKDGERYYRKLAEKSKDPGIRGILTVLANAEVGHAELLQKLRDSHQCAYRPIPIRDNVKNLFAEMMAQGEDLTRGKTDVQVYRKAQGLEVKSRKFYEEKAAELDCQTGKEAFLMIAHEETLHFQILNSLIDLVSRPIPGNWLENAEWYHSPADEY